MDREEAIKMLEEHGRRDVQNLWKVVWSSLIACVCFLVNIVILSRLVMKSASPLSTGFAVADLMFIVFFVVSLSILIMSARSIYVIKNIIADVKKDSVE